MENHQVAAGVALQFVLPLDVVCESCAICDGSGSWTDRRGHCWTCFACAGIGAVSFESFALVQQ